MSEDECAELARLCMAPRTRIKKRHRPSAIGQYCAYLATNSWEGARATEPS